MKVIESLLYSNINLMLTLLKASPTKKEKESEHKHLYETVLITLFDEQRPIPVPNNIYYLICTYYVQDWQRYAM